MVRPSLQIAQCSPTNGAASPAVFGLEDRLFRPKGNVRADVYTDADVSYRRDRAIAQAAHGTAPDWTNRATVTGRFLRVHSARMMRRGIGWTAATHLITRGVRSAVATKTVTGDLQRLTEGAAR